MARTQEIQAFQAAAAIGHLMELGLDEIHYNLESALTALNTKEI